MKTFATILAVFNTLPLSIWVYVAVPTYHLISKGGALGTSLSEFCGYGFMWGTILFPVILIFNHALFIRNYRHQAYRAALKNQIITFAYLILTLTYGFIAFR